MFKRIHSFAGLALMSGLMLFANVQQGYAQEVSPSSIFLNVGYSTYQLNQLKAYNAYILNSLPVEGRLVTDFPGYVIYSGEFYFSSEPGFFGLYVGHSSTGSRISYNDYSGRFRFDQLIRTNSLGGEFGLPIVKEKGLVLNGSLRYLFNMNTIEFDSEYQIPGEYDYQTLNFDSFTHGIQPTISLTTGFRHWLAKIECGYEIQTPAKLLLSQDHNAFLLDENEKEVKYNGSGVRLQVGLGFSFLE
jgi:hypothetical protein